MRARTRVRLRVWARGGVVFQILKVKVFVGIDGGRSLINLQVDQPSDVG